MHFNTTYFIIAIEKTKDSTPTEEDLIEQKN